MKKTEAVNKFMKEGKLPVAEEVTEYQKELSLNGNSKVSVLKSFEYEPDSIEVQDFVKYFKSRYERLKNLLINRPGVESPVSISKLNKSYGNTNTIIAMISDIIKYSTGTIALRLEDPSGEVKGIISKKDSELLEEAKYLAEDEVLAFKGGSGKGVFFINEILRPDVVIKNGKKRSKEEIYAAFTGDLHAGSNTFLPDKLDYFVKLMRGDVGTEEQKRIAEKTKYIFFVGDMVDGVGIYPKQQEELEVDDIYEQYELVADYLRKIPNDKYLIICPGNHDALRIAEPQPPLPKDKAAPLYELPNAVHVSNPAYVNIHNVNGFKGLNVLMYHGYSFDYFLNNIEGLREEGGYDAPDALIKFLLKRRHLAPSHPSTLSVPMKQDPLIIDPTPDVMVTGHIHKAKIAEYKGITTIAASCWQKNTSFQEKHGLHAEPARVPFLNLKTGKAKLLHFE